MPSSMRAALEAVQALQPLAAEVSLALAWVLREPNVVAAIIGASCSEQIDENVAVSGCQVPREFFAGAERIIGRSVSLSRRIYVGQNWWGVTV